MSLLSIALCVFSLAHAAPREGIVRDPNTGDYTITYMGNADMQRAVFVPATKIEPRVFSNFHVNQTGVVEYRYRLTNKKKSKQPVIALRLDPVAEIVTSRPLHYSQAVRTDSEVRQDNQTTKAALLSPRGWNAGAFRRQSRDGSAPLQGLALRVSWSYKDIELESTGLQPGQSEAGFGCVFC